ncbi:hypothetical protein MKZ38_001371 [Zalerion maritima]|uniref:Uncharacterized protein n=1 Tax=Zalerion maritima TaxID=339359 RepID=A0AAD5WLS8_9PEZI|nr:hypothetical protein MKZ38_001371 [Zalerion maritima]
MDSVPPQADSQPQSRDAEKTAISELGVEAVTDGAIIPDDTKETPLPQPNSPKEDCLASSTTPTTTDRTTADGSSLECCCGRFECSYLKHNSAVLENVEKDVQTAAKLGQALLARHEAYMADAEKERMELNDRIGQLKVDKKELEAENTRTIEENRQLLDHLEMLNGAVSDSDLRIKVLESTLQTSQQTIRRLEGAASRAEAMERHISMLEEEQALLQNSIQLTETEARCAMQRWRRAERGINDLQEQLERMEIEGKQEQEKHAETLGRMERQRAVERELNTAEGRLKGAAMVKSFQDWQGETGNPGVVSHFVRDLLQDNANLQLGIAELREMLMVSNDEIQALRDQAMYHQPVNDEDDIEPFAPSSLGTELQQPRVNQELHIHHHYHAPKNEGKKGRRRNRSSLPHAPFNPSISGSLPDPPPAFGNQRFSHSYGTPAQRTRDSISSKANRWSLMSEGKSDWASSVPTSPRSNNRSSAIFDRVATEAPASPTTSIDPMSPSLSVAQRRQSNDVPFLSLSAVAKPVTTPTTVIRRTSLSVHEEEDDESEARSYSEYNGDSAATTHQDEAPPGAMNIPDASLSLKPQPMGFKAASFNPPSTTLPRGHKRNPRRISRTLSHESIKSVGGMDIHTLSARPSQLALQPLGTAVTMATDVTAHATISRGAGTALLRSKMYSTVNRRGGRAVSTPIANRNRSPSVESDGAHSPNIIASNQSAVSQNSKIGRWTSWRPWGSGYTTPTRTRIPETDTTPPVVVEEAGSETHSILSAASSNPNGSGKVSNKAKEKDPYRGPGINQPGAIPGFQEYLAHHRRRGAVLHKPVPERVDLEGLKEVLEE